MKEETESMQGKVPTQPKQPILENRYRINDLENKVKRLETSVAILEVLARKYTTQFGIKVDRFQNGLVVISQI